MTRAELMRRISTQELRYWIALDKIDPRPDLYLIAAVVVRWITSALGVKRVPDLHKVFPHLKQDSTYDHAAEKAKLIAMCRHI